MTTAAATAYVHICRATGDPIRLRRYILSCMDADAMIDYRAACAITGLCAIETDALVQQICAALAAEASEVERAGRNAANCKRWRNKKILTEIGRERTAV